MKTSAGILDIVKLLNPPKLWMVLTLICLLISEMCPFAYPWIFRQLLDHQEVLSYSFFNWSFSLLKMYGLIVIVHGVMLYGKTILAQWIGFRSTHLLRLQIYNQIMRQPLRFFKKTPVGQLMTRMGSDVDATGTLLSEGILEILSNVLLIVTAAAVMIQMDVYLASATLIFFPLIIWVSNHYRLRFRKMQKLFRKELASLNTFLQESLHGAYLIQLFHKHSYFKQMFSRRNNAYVRWGLRWSSSYASFFPAIQTLSDLSLIATYAVGLWLIAKDYQSAGTLAAFAWIASIYSRPLRDLSDRISHLQNALASGDRILDLLSQVNQQSGNASGHIGEDFRHEFTVQHLSFRYLEKGPMVLKDLNFHIPAGQITGIAGLTGGGKSTLLSLLTRMYSPTQGSILFRGLPLEQTDTELFRSQISFLPQESYVFPTSLQENILLGRPLEPEWFWTVCDQMQLTPFIRSWKQQEQTLLGTQGIQLSTGQRQLLSFARALYQKPSVILLDEPTSSMDSVTESLVRSAMRQLLKARTVILVSHRLSSLSLAHQVLFLQEGQIVEQGSAQELMTQQGAFFQTFKSQLADQS